MCDSNNWLDFGGEPDHNEDTWIIKMIFFLSIYVYVKAYVTCAIIQSSVGEVINPLSKTLSL